MKVALLAALLSLLLCGCERGEVVPIAHWTLVRASGDVDVTLPAHLDRWLPPEPGRAVLRSHATLPEPLRGRGLTLAIPRLEAEVSLVAGGEPAIPLETSVLPGYPSSTSHAFHVVVPESGEIDLELRIDRRCLRAGYIETIPRLSPSERGDARYLLVRALAGPVALAAYAVLSMIGFVYFVLFFFDRRRRLNLWFSLQACGVAYYLLEILGVTRVLVGPLFLAPFVMAAASFAGVHFVHAYFGLGPAPRWMRLLPLVLLPSLLAVGAFDTTSPLAMIPLVVLVIIVAYQLVTLARCYRHGRDRFGAAMLFAAWALTFGASPADLIAGAGFGEIAGGAHFLVVGVTLYSIVQATVLGRDHIRSLREADALNAELQARVRLLEERARENALLSDELKKQIADKSHRLAEALARIGVVPERAITLRPGDELQGRYRLVRPLGAGAMGAVFEVERIADSRHLALKVLTAAATGGALARLAREAQVAAEVSHENLVSIVDVDVSEGGALFIVMELVEGAPLANAHCERRERPWALSILRQIACGLAALHDKGIIHRDLKPANVLVTESGTAKIVDFGIARFDENSHHDVAPLSLGRTDATMPMDGAATDPAVAATVQVNASPALTRTGMIVGTPLYMAPELADPAKHAAASSDVWSFGVLACEVLTGKLPFAAPPILDALAGRKVVMPEVALDGMPATVVTIVRRCLALDPCERPHANEIADVFS